MHVKESVVCSKDIHVWNTAVASERNYFKWGRLLNTFRRGCAEMMIKSLDIEGIGKGAACLKLHKIRKYGHLDVMCRNKLTNQPTNKRRTVSRIVGASHQVVCRFSLAAF
jgi:hypothetical protein